MMVAEERREGATRYGLRSAAASMDAASLAQVLQTLGLPPWAALRDIERPGWANQVCHPAGRAHDMRRGQQLSHATSV